MPKRELKVWDESKTAYQGVVFGTQILSPDAVFGRNALNTVIQGPAEGNRVGKQITMCSLQVRCMLKWAPISSAQPDTINEAVKIAIILDTQSNGAIPAVAFYQDPQDPLSFIAEQEEPRFVELRHQIVQPESRPMAVQNTLVNYAGQQNAGDKGTSTTTLDSAGDWTKVETRQKSSALGALGGGSLAGTDTTMPWTGTYGAQSLNAGTVQTKYTNLVSQHTDTDIGRIDYAGLNSTSSYLVSGVEKLVEWDIPLHNMPCNYIGITGTQADMLDNSLYLVTVSGSFSISAKFQTRLRFFG